MESPYSHRALAPSRPNSRCAHPAVAADKLETRKNERQPRGEGLHSAADGFIA